MDFALLKALTEAVAPPGCEGPVRAMLREHLAGVADEMRTDPLGNLLVRRGSGPTRVLLDAHMDEVGLLVSGFTDNGLLTFKTSGGIDPRVLAGRAVWVGTGRLPGVVGISAPHLCKDKDRVIPSDELRIDIGARDRSEAMAVADYGDPVVWATTCERFGEHVIKAKALDDRVGCTLLAEVLREGPWDGLTVWGVFSVQEEIGLRGARTAAWAVDPHVALVLEGTTAADVPGIESPGHVTRFGEGPALSWMDGTNIAPEWLWRHLTAVAEAAGVTWQPRRSITAGTNAGAIHLVRTGVPTATVSVPCRYIHSNAALMHGGDYEQARRLVLAFLESVAKGELAL